MYLPVPLLGYLCDRYSPPPLSLLSSILFGGGYLLAAFTYRSGPPPDTGHGGSGWPFGLMVLAFVGVGSGTCCMYLSAVATCAKNFSLSNHRGFMLAVPIAAFGLSGMWQSQVGAHLLCERLPNGQKGDVDVFRYFLFLGCTLFAVGLVGALGLRIVDEEDLIDRGVEELERSGLLEESEFFRSQNGNSRHPGYGTLNDEADDAASDSNSDLDLNLSESMILKKRDEEERLRRKKTWLLNYETHSFLTDRTMWLLASGFFLLTGPGEAYINNLGTIIPTLTPLHRLYSSPPAGQPSTHVSIIALNSTIARLLTGTLSDLFAPTSTSSSTPSRHQQHRTTFSRLTLLLPSASLLFLSFFILAAPPLVPSNPPLFLASSALLGLGYGASFSLVPIIISVVWGVENFATNWGVVAMMPAGGAALWGIVYSVGYSRAAVPGVGGDTECKGAGCFEGWAWGCAASVGVAIVLWAFAWKNWRRRGVVV
jgi:MFS family permease